MAAVAASLKGKICDVAGNDVVANSDRRYCATSAVFSSFLVVDRDRFAGLGKSQHGHWILSLACKYFV